VIGVDFSAVQLRRAQRLVPAARLVQADMAAFCLRPKSADAMVSFYALIHVPVADQKALFPRIGDWLRPGGYFLAIVGAEQWTGTEPYLGTDMFWDHADTATYLRWLQAAQLMPIWNRYITEGDSGHSSYLPRRPNEDQHRPVSGMSGWSAAIGSDQAGRPSAPGRTVLCARRTR
jgi:SAM-dependent methyltransferase